MAYIDTRGHLDIAIFLGRGVRAAYAFRDAILDWDEARRTRRALAALTEYQLDDIGLSRWDIESVATKTFFR